MPWNLLSLGGGHRGEQFPLRPLPFVIGRGAGSQLRPKSAAVAERHCTLSDDDGLLVVEDHGTEFGTYLDGAPVVSPVYASAGSVLQLGPLYFKLCWADEPSDARMSVEERAGTVLTG
jgi:pSer/pThr/pTyr-binding forkhead associated (FHA) protein